MRIHPKKSLGQNFLIDPNIRGKIITALGLKPADIVLEIGAGRGELTKMIAQAVKKIYSLEIDKYLCSGLEESCRGIKNLRVMRQDILKFNLAGFIKSAKIKARIKVFGNIPYYISSPIIAHFLKYHKRISAIFITTQKEFAKRVVAVAGSKEYGAFSCFAQYYTCPKVIFDISKNCFRPAPKVDSSFLELKIRQEPHPHLKDEKLFFKIIRGAFNQRRKTLGNSLRGIVSGSVLDEFFAKSGLDRMVRPERLTLENFALLTNLQILSKKGLVKTFLPP